MRYVFQVYINSNRNGLIRRSLPIFVGTQEEFDEIVKKDYFLKAFYDLWRSFEEGDCVVSFHRYVLSVDGRIVTPNCPDESWNLSQEGPHETGGST